MQATLKEGQVVTPELRPDIGLEHLFVNGKSLTMQGVPSRLCLNFVGKVVFVPVVGAIPICENFGQVFYVTGHGLPGLIDYDFFICTRGCDGFGLLGPS